MGPNIVRTVKSSKIEIKIRILRKTRTALTTGNITMLLQMQESLQWYRHKQYGSLKGKFPATSNNSFVLLIISMQFS